MPFKSHLAVLVLMLCGLYLTGSADSYRDNIIQLGVKNIIQPTDTHKTAHDSQPTTKDKTSQTTVKKTTQAAKEEKTAHDSLTTNKDRTTQTNVKKITQAAKEDKTAHNSLTTPIIQHTGRDKTTKTKESKLITKSDNGGSSAIIPSMFTIASLICVLLL